MAKVKKSQAARWVCQSREMTMEAIRALGDARRELTRLETHINDQVAQVTDQHKQEVEALQQRIETLSSGIQIWCEANRAQLLEGGGKEANLITGLVRWRQRPPSVSIRGVDKVLEALRTLGLQRFIRTKEEPNKEAMLADPKAVQAVPGLSIVSGVEDFIVEPFEVEVQ